MNISPTHPATPPRNRPHVRSRIIAIALLGLGLGFAPAPTAMPVEVSHPVVDFLRRLEEKGLVEPGFWSTLPRDEAEVARVLESAARQSARLGAWDRRRLEHYRDLFDPQRKRRGTRLRYEDSAFTLHGGAEYFTGLYFRDSIPRGEHWGFGSFTGNLQLTYQDWAYLTSGGTVGSERGYHARFSGENFDPAGGLPYAVDREGLNDFSGKVSTFDAFRMVVGAGTRHLRLELGQDWNQWGPGHWQHATLGSRPWFWIADSLPASEEAGYPGPAQYGIYRHGYRYTGEGPPLPQVRLRFGSDHWEYVKVVAQRTGLWKDSAALLVTHRVQIRLGSWRFGLTEMLAIGSRETGWLPWLPAVPLRVLEHEGGNRDNAAMSGDVEWIWRGHGRLYGEFFLDDFSGPPIDFWGNKFAWTLGGSWHDPLGLPAELRAEYSRVDPWVYGHHLRGSQMQSYGALLGSSLSPNAHAFTTSLTVPLPLGTAGTGTYRFGQRAPTEPGSSIFDVHNGRNEKYEFHKGFLADNVETRQDFIVEFQREWGRYVDLRIGTGWLLVEGWKGKPGLSLSTPTFAGEIHLRY